MCQDSKRSHRRWLCSLFKTTAPSGPIWWSQSSQCYVAQPCVLCLGGEGQRCFGLGRRFPTVDRSLWATSTPAPRIKPANVSLTLRTWEHAQLRPPRPTVGRPASHGGRAGATAPSDHLGDPRPGTPNRQIPNSYLTHSLFSEFPASERCSLYICGRFIYVQVRYIMIVLNQIPVALQCVWLFEEDWLLLVFCLATSAYM